MGRIDVEGFKEKFGVRFHVWLDKKYNKEGLSYREIGDILGCSTTTVGNHMQKYDIHKKHNAVRKVRTKVNPAKVKVPNQPKRTRDGGPGYALFTKLSRILEGEPVG